MSRRSAASPTGSPEGRRHHHEARLGSACRSGSSKTRAPRGERSRAAARGEDRAADGPHPSGTRLSIANGRLARGTRPAWFYQSPSRGAGQHRAQSTVHGRGDEPGTSRERAEAPGQQRRSADRRRHTRSAVVPRRGEPRARRARGGSVRPWPLACPPPPTRPRDRGRHLRRRDPPQASPGPCRSPFRAGPRLRRTPAGSPRAPRGPRASVRGCRPSRGLANRPRGSRWERRRRRGR